MSVTRVATREELVCLICHKPGVALDHIRERSLAPELKHDPWNIAPLCPACHDLKHQKRILTKVVRRNNLVPNDIYMWKQRGKDHPWIRVDVHENKRHKCLEAGNAAAESGHGSDQTQRTELTMKKPLGQSLGPTEGSAAAFPASGESSAAEPPVRGALPGPAGDSCLVPSPSAAPPSVFDLSSWCAEGMQLVYFGIALRDGQDEVRFRIGDWYNRGEGILGEETVGYLRGFEDVTVRQYSWVAGCVAPDTRVLELSWSYHRAVAALPAPKQKEWLDKARDENLTTRQLHQAIHGKKPKVKRWTLEELRELVKEFDDVEAADESEYTFTPPQFLNWLEAK